MGALQLRILENFLEPEFTILRTAAFANFGEASKLLSNVLADEANHWSQASESKSQFLQ